MDYKVRIGTKGLIVSGDIYVGWNIKIQDNLFDLQHPYDTFYLFLFNEKEGYDNYYFRFSDSLNYIYNKHMKIIWEKDDYDVKKNIPFSMNEFMEKKEITGIILSGKRYVDFYIRIFCHYDIDTIENSFIIDLSLEPNYDLDDINYVLEFTERQWVGDYKNVEYFLGRYDFEIKWFI